MKFPCYVHSLNVYETLTLGQKLFLGLGCVDLFLESLLTCNLAFWKHWTGLGMEYSARAGDCVSLSFLPHWPMELFSLATQSASIIAVCSTLGALLRVTLTQSLLCISHQDGDGCAGLGYCCPHLALWDWWVGPLIPFFSFYCDEKASDWES